MLINEKTWEYIRQHADDDVRKLALLGCRDVEVDLTMALQQIAGRQTARKKLPSWAAIDGLVYPPHLNMEQCSSEQTARYKAQIAGKGETFIDLTGGFGVDFYWMSQGFGRRIYVEQDAALCEVAEHNFRMLGLTCSVCCCKTATYLTGAERADVVFLDPARRNEHGGRTYGIEDCTPNVLELLPMLLEKADRIVLKLSPMLDWRKAVSDISHHPCPSSQKDGSNKCCVTEVHIVSVDNECKELLLVIEKKETDGLRLCCDNDGCSFEVVSTAETGCLHGGNTLFPRWEQGENNLESETYQYLYEPNASIMKAGCFAELEQRFAVRQVSANSHLFLSAVEIGDFPGRRFSILSISSMNKKELSASLSTVERANIAVRNFPLTAEQLRRKLKMKDGGDVYIFATTLADGGHRLFICRKIG